MSRFVVGTAGHIDHGKTTLIRALTGIPTDRLAEEQKRGISIVSGYAFLDYKGEKISIVDVPGHERFIKNMLSGVSGIDLVLLVVAADEGVMPQTREHLDIIRLLGIDRGLIVMTKCDLVDDEMIEMVEMDIEDLVEGTTYENFPIYKVSGKTGQGLDEIKDYIFSQYDESLDIKPYYPRLYIDRVFKGKGIGDIVTGTLEGADLSIQKPLCLYPFNEEFRIRSIESHGESTDMAQSHSRVALVLQGDKKELLEPGLALAPKNKYHDSRSLIVEIESLEGLEERLLINDSFKAYFGSDEFFARLHHIEENYYELELDRATLAFYGQRGILRQMSPVITLGGIKVLDSRPLLGKKNKLRSVKQLRDRDFISRLNYIGWKYPLGFTMEDLEKEMVLREDFLKETLEKHGINLVVQGNRYFTKSSLIRQQEELIENLQELVEDDPIKEYWDKEVLRSRFYKTMDREGYERMLVKAQEEKSIDLDGRKIKPHGFKLLLSPDQEKAKAKILEIFTKDGYELPSFNEVKSKLNPEEGAILEYLIQKSDLISINSEFFMEKEMLSCLKNDIIKLGKGNKTIEIAQVRDELGLTRKYIVPYLEYFDRIGVTERVDKVRILTKEYKNG
ncbi:MAG: selenocysteine-specific translation elongation factor [Tissierellia bacterium]|nr:selenocysteine-specific translation elongation factor [Tissierellia bacterium]